MPIILVDMTDLPQPSGDFEWVQAPWGAALRCRPLEAIAPHCFTTRELALEGVRDEDAGSWQVLSRSMGVEIDGLVRMRQVHGAEVYVAEKGSGGVFHSDGSGKPLPTLHPLTTRGRKAISPSATIRPWCSA